MGKNLIVAISEVFRAEHYAYRSEETYLRWIKRYISFYGNKHPRKLVADEIQGVRSPLDIQ